MDYRTMVNGKPGVKCDIELDGKKGHIWLCSTYGCYDHQTDIEIPLNNEVTFFCPHCQEELNTGIKCDVCSADMVKFNIEIGGVVNICSRAGCKNHYVMFEDLESTIRKYTQEFGI